tara:strand:+ start:40124 stop:42913 length:2790 start_codon:yes stop_codon:yes gene_type:complete
MEEDKQVVNEPSTEKENLELVDHTIFKQINEDKTGEIPPNVSNDDNSEKKDNKILNNFFNKSKSSWYVSIILIFILWLSYFLRTRNLKFLLDKTTNDFILINFDGFLFLRYAQQILSKGAIMANDVLRYFPYGFDTTKESTFLSYFLVYLFKFMNFFNSDVTLNYISVIYPPLLFAVSLIFFFLFLRKILDYKIALLSSFFLAIIPITLPKTVSGLLDKEPLAILFMFMTLYFFFSAWKSEKLRNVIILAVLAGVSNGLMMLTWGGAQFLFILIALFMLTFTLLKKTTKEKLLIYGIWMVLGFSIPLIFSGRFTFFIFSRAVSSEVSLVVFMISLLSYSIYEKNLFNLKEKLKKYPKALVLIVFSFLIGFLVISLFRGTSFLHDILRGFTTIIGKTRWGFTVVESKPVYLINFINGLSKKGILLFILGSSIMFYSMIKSLNKYKYQFLSLYVFILLALLFSRTNKDSVFNGDSITSLIFLTGSFVIFLLYFIIIYIYSYYKDENTFEKFEKLDDRYIFLFVFILISFLLSRTALRLNFLIAPIVAISISYLILFVFKKVPKIKSKNYRIVTYIVIIFLLISPFAISSNMFFGLLDKGLIIDYIQEDIRSHRNFVPFYNSQWQEAGEWIRENTLKDSVFVNWWDYGYMIQYGGERATLSDGGNALASLNHFIGRHVLTAQSEEKALEFFKSRGGDYLLIHPADIPKYPAFSSIGSDTNYDRYAVFGLFKLNNKEQGIRNEDNLVYSGGVSFFEPFEYQGKIYPPEETGVINFNVPVKIKKENGEQKVEFSQPTAVIANKNQQFRVPVNCLYVDDKLYEYEGEGLGGCLNIIVGFVNNDIAHIYGNALYLSSRIKDSLFAQLYLFDKQTPNFELVYEDEEIFLQRLDNIIKGPIKIWKINIPEDTKLNVTFQQNHLPDAMVRISNETYRVR